MHFLLKKELVGAQRNSGDDKISLVFLLKVQLLRATYLQII